MKSRRCLACFAAVFLLAACRTAPVIFEVRDNLVSANMANPAKEDVRKAIIRAGISLGWQMKDNGPNAMIGMLTLMLRSHVAVVDIPYTATTYSITDRDSMNLHHNGTSIHSNYNGWIQNLNKAITVQLSAL